METGLKDRLDKAIKSGNVVHWTDGGDDLPLEVRIKTRWDRIAVVGCELPVGVTFTVIDSPHKPTRDAAHKFKYASFIYTNTEKHLTVVADNIEDYKDRYANAGDCMKWVLENAGAANTLEGYTKMSGVDGVYIKMGK